MGSYRYLPKWLKDKYEEGEKYPKTKKKLEKVTDFPVLIENIWCISNQDYQERIWVNHETQDIVDSYDDTTMYFFEDVQAILSARDAGRVNMTDRQYEMLKKLYNMADTYDSTLPYPEFDQYDKEIISDHQWHEIRDYAKLVYKEITQTDPQ